MIAAILQVFKIERVTVSTHGIGVGAEKTLTIEVYNVIGIIRDPHFCFTLKAANIGIVLIRSLCQGLKGPPLSLSQFADSRSDKVMNCGHNATHSLRKMLISPETMSLRRNWTPSSAWVSNPG